MSTWLIILAIALAVVLLVIVNLANRPAKCIDKAHYINEWNDVVELSKHPKSRPLSIVHADKLLDDALRALGYNGTTMAERLVAAKSKLKNKDDIWKAHKLRNKIVHETAYEPSEANVQKSLQAYRKTFKDLGVW